MTGDEYKTAQQACDMLRTAIYDGVNKGLRTGLQAPDPDHYRKTLWMDVYTATVRNGSPLDARDIADLALKDFDVKFK